ncbi:MAG: flagellar hook-length control protein FliK [Candidatus Latescibacterota bacterium]
MNKKLPVFGTDAATPAVTAPAEAGEAESRMQSDHEPIREKLSYENAESPKKIVPGGDIASSVPPDDSLPGASEDHRYRFRDSRVRMDLPEGGKGAAETVSPEGSAHGESVLIGMEEDGTMAGKSRKAPRAGSTRLEQNNTSILVSSSGRDAGSETEGYENNPGRLAARGSAPLLPRGETALPEGDATFGEIMARNGSETEGDGAGEGIPVRFDPERGFRITGTARGEQVQGYRGIYDSSMLEMNILNAIVRHAKLLLGNGQSSATIMLEPPSLGKMKLEIVTENAKVAGKILVESKEVQDIIRNNLPELRQNLIQSGLQVESFDVQVGHNGGTDGWAQRENMESTASLFRAERARRFEIAGDAAAPPHGGRRNTARAPGYLDVWM